MYFIKNITRRKIKLVQLADIIVTDLHLLRNDIVMVNCSLNNFTLTDSKPEDLIYLLKMIVGTKGTLLMSAFSKDHFRAESGNGVKGTGNDKNRIYELFRQMPDTFRSSHSDEPFAVWGSLAKKIANNHSVGEDEKEPIDLYSILTQERAKIIGIGVPVTDYSFQHLIAKTNYKESTGRHFDEISKDLKDGDLKIFTKRGIPFYILRAEKADQILKTETRLM